ERHEEEGGSDAHDPHLNRRDLVERHGGSRAIFWDESGVISAQALRA
ncbi:MAG: hypothetical protein ACI9VR_004246, partial [Cognaticolwellia sp.]